MNIKETVEFCWQHEACIRQAIEDKRNDCGTVSHGCGGSHAAAFYKGVIANETLPA